MVIDRRLSSIFACLLFVAALACVARATATGAASEPFPTAAAAPALDFGLSAAAVKVNCAAAIARAQEKIDAIVTRTFAVPYTFATAVLPLEEATADLNDETLVETLLSSIATSRAVRDASYACQNDESAFFNALSARPDLYAALVTAKESSTAATTAERKLTDLWIITLRRAGAALPAGDRVKFVSLSNKLAQLQNSYSANLDNDTTTIRVSVAAAQGLPPDFLATLQKSGDAYLIPVTESTSEAVLQNASDPATRKAYYFASANRGMPKNKALLLEALVVRAQLAHLLGYPNWAAYVLADRMAESPARVTSFLSQLDATLLPRARADIARLAALKAANAPQDDTPLSAWDVLYYDNQLRKSQYAVDAHAVAQYFPVAHVVTAVFGIYSKILGVTFAKRVHPNLWQPDVTEWTVTDTATGRYLGDFWLDLFPRDGKYSHVASFTLLPNRRLADGHVRPPLDAIIGNWPKPAPGFPAVLSHSDVETFFHEFGHDMATMLATTPYETLSSGFRQDFIEAPSQMLENWVWDPQILKELSSNVSTGAPLPDDLIAKIRAARYVDNAYFTTRQIMLADIDIAYHTENPPFDTTALWRQIANAVTPLPLPLGSHPEASFGHLMGGYDAGYYGYLWSKVYAQDMFTAFQAGGLESPDVGARYRKDILAPARELEPDAEVRAFLGRPMNPAAFYKEFDQEGT